jgi:tocopherol cyclase
VTPLAGWGGGPGQKQQATAGWLAALPVFEPHWQVLMSHGLATGWLQWGDTRYEFADAPFYAEKNWGGAFPRKWFWVQCNAWEGVPGLALTCAGAVRDLPLLRLTENVGLMGIHIPQALLDPAAPADSYVFIELMPTTGVLDWSVQPWGSWRITGRNRRWEASLVAECDPGAGTPLRAPTADRGLAAACKDTFAGRATLCVWDRTRPAGSGPVLKAMSTQAALETGGGPWFETWNARSEMKEPLRSATLLPVDVDAVRRVIPQWDPPGL